MRDVFNEYILYPQKQLNYFELRLYLHLTTKRLNDY